MLAWHWVGGPYRGGNGLESGLPLLGACALSPCLTAPLPQLTPALGKPSSSSSCLPGTRPLTSSEALGLEHLAQALHHAALLLLLPPRRCQRPALCHSAAWQPSSELLWCARQARHPLSRVPSAGSLSTSILKFQAPKGTKSCSRRGRLQLLPLASPPTTRHAPPPLPRTPSAWSTRMLH
jgi:hypothetical protein